MKSKENSVIISLFGRSKSWVSKAQTRAVDPMPRDLAGATAWGRRLGLLAAAPIAAKQPNLPFGESPASNAAMEFEDIRLKQARRLEIEQRTAIKDERLISLDTVEHRETAIAAEFRRAAVEFTLRTRVILDRFVPDASVIECIVREMQPMAAELLNKADARQALRGKSKDVIRATLIAWVDHVTETLA